MDFTDNDCDEINYSLNIILSTLLSHYNYKHHLKLNNELRNKYLIMYKKWYSTIY